MAQIAALCGRGGLEIGLAQSGSAVLRVQHCVALPWVLLHAVHFEESEGIGALGLFWVQSLCTRNAGCHAHRHVDLDLLPVLIVNGKEGEGVREAVDLAVGAEGEVAELDQKGRGGGQDGDVHVTAQVRVASVGHRGAEDDGVGAGCYQVVLCPSDFSVWEGDGKAVKIDRLVARVLDEDFDVLQLRQRRVVPRLHGEHFHVRARHRRAVLERLIRHFESRRLLRQPRIEERGEAVPRQLLLLLLKEATNLSQIILADVCGYERCERREDER